MVQRANGSLLAYGGNVGMVVGKKPYAQIVFQERINAVERAAWPTASDSDVVITHNDVQILRAQIVDAESDRASLHDFTRADEHVFVPSCDLLDDRQLHSAGLVKKS